MTSWPILSVVTFLPLVGALFIATLNEDEAGAAQYALGGDVDDAHHFRDLADPDLAVRSVDGRFPVRRETAVARRRDQLFDGRRRHFAAVRDPDHRAHADLHPGELDCDPEPRARIHDRVPRPRNADGRHVLRARPRLVLSVLRRHPHSDVPDHRRLGRPAPRLCELQVLPLHAARLGADAARHHGDVLGRRDDRHSDAAASSVSARPADRGVVRLPRLLCGEDADVAGPHLAAGRACRSADRRLGDPCRDPSESWAATVSCAFRCRCSRKPRSISRR